jgi:hypothetical protein
VVCQEFNCLPDEAERQDSWQIRRILALRSFAHSWGEIDKGVEQKDLTKTPQLENVMLVHIKRARGEID